MDGNFGPRLADFGAHLLLEVDQRLDGFVPEFERRDLVLVLDADLGLANLDVVLNLYPKLTLHDVFTGQSKLDDAILPAPGGFSVLLAGSGMIVYSRLTSTVRDQLHDVIQRVRPRFDRVLLRLPMLGQVARKFGTSQMARTLATLLGGGLPLVNALDISSKSIGNQYMASQLELVGALGVGDDLGELPEILERPDLGGERLHLADVPEDRDRPLDPPSRPAHHAAARDDGGRAHLHAPVELVLAGGEDVRKTAVRHHLADRAAEGGGHRLRPHDLPGALVEQDDAAVRVDRDEPLDGRVEDGGQLLERHRRCDRHGFPRPRVVSTFRE